MFITYFFYESDWNVGRLHFLIALEIFLYMIYSKLLFDNFITWTTILVKSSFFINLFNFFYFELVLKSPQHGQTEDNTNTNLHFWSDCEHYSNFVLLMVQAGLGTMWCFGPWRWDWEDNSRRNWLLGRFTWVFIYYI